MFFSSASSKFSRTKVVTVVMMPMNRLTQDRVTKAELGMEKMKEKGYIRGTEDQPYISISRIRGPRLASEMYASAPNTKNMMMQRQAEMLRQG